MAVTGSKNGIPQPINGTNIMKKKIILIALPIFFFLSWNLSGQVLVKTTDITCSGKKNGKASLIISNAPGPYKIKWLKNGAEIAENKDRILAVGLDGGNYKVEITDKNDCMIEREFEIKEPGGIELSITSSTGEFSYCGSKSFPDVTLFCTSSGGTAPLSCSVNSCLKRVSAPGEYSFTVTDKNGCQETESVRVDWVGIVCSSDPNDITGPTGYEEDRWVKADQPMEYTIRFENDPEFATSPAQLVYVEYIFDPKVNPFSLRLGNFGFGDFLYTLPFSDTYHQERLDLQSEMGIWVDVVAGIDINDNKAFWSFQTIDPQTGLPPIDPQIGFLPVNDSLIGNGEGFVTFSVTPKTTATTGDIVSAEADIIFDANEAINTNTWTNVLDAFPPTSELNPLDSVSNNPTVLLSWNAADDSGGCGIRDFALYYQVNNGPFLLHGDGIMDTFLLFNADPGKTYGFYVTGTDHVDNMEQKMMAEQTIRINPSDFIEILSPHAVPACLGDTMVIAWNTTNIDSMSLSMTLDSGESYFILSPLLLPGDSSLSIVIVDSMLTEYAEIVFASLEDTIYEVRTGFFPIKSLPEVQISGDDSICDNEVANLNASGGNFYTWTPTLFLDNATSANPTAYIDSSMTYYVHGRDVFGCVNVDSVTIQFHPTHIDTFTHEMCNEDSVFVGGAYQTEPGFYTDELSSSKGCDSTVTTQVILNGPCPFGSSYVFVDKDATGLNNGRSWTNAFTDLQDALAAVEYYLDVREIWIAEGDYFPSMTGDRDTSFVLRDSVVIYGGFLGIESSREERVADPALVRISGDVGLSNDTTDNAYHVVVVESNCVDCRLDGLTVTFGQADGMPAGHMIGAGLYVKGKIMIESVIIERNTSIGEGAAIYNEGMNANLTLRDCIFRLNAAGLERDILNTNGAQLKFEGMNQIED
jgi:hypothetical protein